jgi:3',5'-cyclic-AMP phosphodiesterase
MLIAQVTDTHIRANGKPAYGQVDTAGYLSACVRHLNSLPRRPDAVLFTGDLTDYGQPDEYALFRRLIRPLEMPWFVIPGNHDDRVNFREAFPEIRDWRGHPDFIQYCVDDFPVRLVGLDTYAGPKEGMLCERRLAWLDECLREQPDRATLIFMHHPPFLTGIRHMDVQNCRNGAGLASVLRRHPQVSRLICGHVHRVIQVHWNGITASIAPSPAHSVALDLSQESPPAFVMEPACCHLHYLSEEGLVVSHLSFIGEFDGPYPFFASDGRLIE